jgi:alpha-L-fucosidase
MLPYPWESCIIAGGGWSWVPNPNFMSPRRAIHMLVDIVAKGGNLLYNIAPGPDGKWPEGAYTLLNAMGEWIDVNGEAIYGTRAIAPYKSGNICFTRKKDTETVYAIYLPEGNQDKLPATIEVKGIKAAKGAKISLLGASGTLKWEAMADGLKIHVPGKLQQNLPCKEAWAFKISETE